ncbi:MAG: hypothetical protein ABI462_08340 [Ignavibacteria bacterium]
MKSKLLLVILGIIILSANGCGLLSKKYTKTKTDEFRLNSAGKKKIKLDNVNGTITLTHNSDSGAIMIKAVKEIKVKKKYLDTPFDEIAIRIDTSTSVISIETEIGKKGEDDIFKFNIDRNQRVNYEIHVPSGIDLEVDNINGNLVANDLNNDLMIDLVNGQVSVEHYTGLLECEISNGAFTGNIDSTRGMNLSIINGNITLYLNNYMNANVRAETNKGKIIEENLDFRDAISEKRLFKGKLGKNEPNVDIKVETVNGRIRLYGRKEI